MNIEVSDDTSVATVATSVANNCEFAKSSLNDITSLTMTGSVENQPQSTTQSINSVCEQVNSIKSADHQQFLTINTNIVTDFDHSGQFCDNLTSSSVHLPSSSSVNQLTMTVTSPIPSVSGGVTPSTAVSDPSSSVETLVNQQVVNSTLVRLEQVAYDVMPSSSNSNDDHNRDHRWVYNILQWLQLIQLFKRWVSVRFDTK